MKNIVKIGKELIAMKESFVIAKIVDTHGSTPRKKGAWLIMRENGTRYGTVGGGKLEADVEQIALATFETKEAKVYHFALTPKEQQGLDMRCGGDADVSIEYVDAEKPESFTSDFECKGKVYIFGAGHVGQALEPILRYVNFSTVVIDDRHEFANRERFPSADEVVVINSFDRAYEGVEIDEDSYIIIMTRGHIADYEVLKQSLSKTTKYIGMIGSRSKVLEVFKLLEKDGYSKEQLDKVYSPVGTSIFAETPEEIAISIVGEMIKVRSGHGEK